MVIDKDNAILDVNQALITVSGRAREALLGLPFQTLFTDPARAPLMPLNFYLLEAIQNAAKRNLFAEALQANRGFDMFDKVNGTDATRRDLAAGRSAASIVRSWKMGEDNFRKMREKYLLY